MKKFRLLLLDANVVIEISRSSLWKQVLARCEIHLSQTVIGEAHFYEDDEGERQPIDLQPHIASGDINVFDLKPSDLAALHARFDSSYCEKLDPGETESLAYMLQKGDECLICSADKIVYRVLGSLRRAEQGVSLEEVLQQIGLGRKLSREFSREYREQWTQKGFEEGLGGTGRAKGK